MRHLSVLLVLVLLTSSQGGFNTYTREELVRWREEVREMFQHSYNSYLEHAYPYDELRPLSCDGVDTWGSYSLTLIDALDTLAVIGNYSEFSRVYSLLAQRTNFDVNINVSGEHHRSLDLISTSSSPCFSIRDQHQDSRRVAVRPPVSQEGRGGRSPPGLAVSRSPPLPSGGRRPEAAPGLQYSHWNAVRDSEPEARGPGG